MKVKHCENALRQFILITFITLSCIGSTHSLHAQRGIAGAFLRMGIGARAKAMGGAYTALAKNVEASYYNPAGLPFLEHKEVMASFNILSLDRQFSFIGFGVPIHPKIKDGAGKMLDGGFSLAWIRAGVGNIDGRDSDGRETGSLSNSENAFIFSFALKPVNIFSVGLSVKVIWNRFPGVGSNGETVSANGVGFDLGALVQPNQWVTVGISVRDINSKYTWNTGKLYGETGSEVINRFPKIVRTGVAFRVPKIQQFTFAIDFEDSKKLDSRLRFGVEGIFKQGFVLRGGLDDDGTISAGGGYHFNIFGKMSQLNYAFISQGELIEEEHIFTWVFQF